LTNSGHTKPFSEADPESMLHPQAGNPTASLNAALQLVQQRLPVTYYGTFVDLSEAAKLFLLT